MNLKIKTLVVWLTVAVSFASCKSDEESQENFTKKLTDGYWDFSGYSSRNFSDEVLRFNKDNSMLVFAKQADGSITRDIVKKGTWEIQNGNLLKVSITKSNYQLTVTDKISKMESSFMELASILDEKSKTTIKKLDNPVINK